MDGANVPAKTSRARVRQLAARITELTGHLNAASYRWLMLIAEFDRLRGWNDGATQSCAHWLNWQCGINLGAARERIRVAHALGKLPQISAAMERGSLSYAKVRALTRIAHEANEDYLLRIALRGTASQVENLVRGYRRCKEAEELSREAQQYVNRSVSWVWDTDGSLIVRARLTAEAGRRFIQAIEQVVDAMPRKRDVSAERESGHVADVKCRRADAVGIVAESFLSGAPADKTGAERSEIVVHVDAETLRNSTAGRCELERGPSLAAETARRMACDASTYTIVENERGEPLSIGRKSRTISPAIRRALNARDDGCRFPSCPNKRFVDGHHIKHWANGGETSLDNLVTLCGYHHRQVHEGRVLVQKLDGGAIRFTKPDGQSFDSPLPFQAQMAGAEHLMAENRAAGLEIDEATACTRWSGERMDYVAAMASLFSIDKGTRVSAETRGAGGA